MTDIATTVLLFDQHESVGLVAMKQNEKEVRCCKMRLLHSVFSHLLTSPYHPPETDNRTP